MTVIQIAGETIPRAFMEEAATAELVISASGVVLKDRFGETGRRATNEELASARAV